MANIKFHSSLFPLILIAVACSEPFSSNTLTPEPKPDAQQTPGEGDGAAGEGDGAAGEVGSGGSFGGTDGKVVGFGGSIVGNGGQHVSSGGMDNSDSGSGTGGDSPADSGRVECGGICVVLEGQCVYHTLLRNPPDTACIQCPDGRWYDPDNSCKNGELEMCYFDGKLYRC